MKILKHIKRWYSIKKFILISAFFSLNITLFMPLSLFSQGAVVGYADGNKRVNANNVTSFPTNAQLDKLTHVIAVGLGVYTSGALKKSDLPGSWNGNTNTWIASLVNRAHQRGVKVSICITGRSEFNSATSTQHKINAFVNEIASFVNANGLDGVDIDWERPGVDSNGDPLPYIQDQIKEWNQCTSLLVALKSSLPNKRITIAFPHGNWIYPNPTIQLDIWDTADLIHLMTYDVEDGVDGWPNHSNADYSIGGIDNWIPGGTPISYRKKLFLGCAFYGYKKNSHGNTLWGDRNKVSYVTYSGGGNYNHGDLPEDVQNKAIQQ